MLNTSPNLSLSSENLSTVDWVAQAKPRATVVRQQFICAHCTCHFLTEKKLFICWTRNIIAKDKFYHDSSFLKNETLPTKLSLRVVMVKSITWATKLIKIVACSTTERCVSMSLSHYCKIVKVCEADITCLIAKFSMIFDSKVAVFETKALQQFVVLWHAFREDAPGRK